MMKKSLIQEKTYAFALSIIELYRLLIRKNEYVMSKQLLKAGTSIGANVEEALAGQSRPDFLSKMSIASKEARESNYWLRLLGDSGIIERGHLEKPLAESKEIVCMLTSIVKTTAGTTERKNSTRKTQN